MVGSLYVDELSFDLVSLEGFASLEEGLEDVPEDIDDGPSDDETFLDSLDPLEKSDESHENIVRLSSVARSVLIRRFTPSL